MRTLLCWPLLLLVGLLPRDLSAAAPAYVAVGSIDFTGLLAAPPDSGSPEARADLDLTYRVHTNAAPGALARARNEATLTVFHFAPVIGPWFRAERLPKTAALFLRVEADAKAMSDAAKAHFRRLRPYHLEPVLFGGAIEHEPPTEYSYPSGHATRGLLFAWLLAECFPGKRNALLEKGRESGWLRVVGGVHFSSDVQAGRVLGQALAREFLRSSEFQRDLAEVQAELRAAAAP